MTITTVRRTRNVILSLSICSLSNVALATPYVQPTSAEEAPEEPMAWRAAPLSPPPTAGRKPRLKADVPPSAVGQAQTNVFFLNYDGVTLKYTGDDDATKNETAFKEFAAKYEPYGEGSKRAASLQAVKADWAKYNVVITDERPAEGEYTMCVISPTNVFGGGVLGVAMLDCEDKKVASNAVLAFHSAKDKYSAATQATTISQEIAHAYGLEHVNQPNDIMNPYNAGGDPSFRDECLKLDSNTPVRCGAQHKKFCDKGQNSHAELVWLFGESAPDPVPPTVAITSPKDGEQFTAPALVTITVEASDNVGVTQVDLYIDGVNQNAPIKAPPYEWKDAKFPAGTFCVAAEARDGEPNLTMSDEVCFTVVEPGAPDDPGEPGDPGSSSGGDDSGGETSGEPGPGATGGEAPQGGDETGGETSSGGEPEADSEADEPAPGDSATAGETSPNPGPQVPPQWGEKDDEDGCGCTQQSSSGAAGLLVLLLAAVGRRRRRP
jgi:uncharacterized protein (TIGR03382 family)